MNLPAMLRLLSALFLFADRWGRALGVSMVRWIGRVQLVVGLLGIVAFVATGQYMDRVHGHLRGYDDTLRLLYRSTHIYLLLSAVANTLVGLYVQPAAGRVRRGLQLVGSAALVAGPPLFLVAFCTEPYLSELDRPWTRPAVYLALAGTLFHMLAAIPTRRAAGDV